MEQTKTKLLVVGLQFPSCLAGTIQVLASARRKVLDGHCNGVFQDCAWPPSCLSTSFSPRIILFPQTSVLGVPLLSLLPDGEGYGFVIPMKALLKSESVAKLWKCNKGARCEARSLFPLRKELARGEGWLIVFMHVMRFFMRLSVARQK